MDSRLRRLVSIDLKVLTNVTHVTQRSSDAAFAIGRYWVAKQSKEKARRRKKNRFGSTSVFPPHCF